MGGRLITPPFLTSTMVSLTPPRPLYHLSPPGRKYGWAPVACPGVLGEKEKFFTSAVIETRLLICLLSSLSAILIQLHRLSYCLRLKIMLHLLFVFVASSLAQHTVLMSVVDHILRLFLWVFCFICCLSFPNQPIQIPFFLQSVVLNSSKISSLNCTSFRSTSSFIPSASFFLLYHLHHFTCLWYSRSTNTIV